MNSNEKEPNLSLKDRIMKMAKPILGTALLFGAGVVGAEAAKAGLANLEAGKNGFANLYHAVDNRGQSIPDALKEIS